MKQYLKLLNFEINRFSKVLFVLIGITVVFQIGVTIYYANDYVKRLNEAIYKNLQTKAQFFEMNPKISLFDITNTRLFLLSVMVCIIVLLIYAFFIWYRDWFAKNTFIYRLLMLPTSRMNIYFAKASTIFVSVLGLVGIQIILFLIENALIKGIVPREFRLDVNLYQVMRAEFIQVMIPTNFVQFLLNYGIGFMAIFVLFTIILLERSFRLKGALLGIVYGIATIGLFLLPLFLDGRMRFYPEQLFGLLVTTGVIVTACSIWLSHYLLKNKVTV